jgi:Alpha/beta hydrolase domain
MTEPVLEAIPGKPLLLLGAFEIDSVGYVAEEFFFSGIASSYDPAGPLDPDGQWRVTPSDAADFTTRVVAMVPADRSQFNGTVLVEWLNVSGGIDAPAVWMMAHREIVRAGYAYVAVSAQKVGVDGGASLLGIDMSLKSQDPSRYASLNHPGDAFAFDIFSQVGGLLKSGGLLGELRPQHVVALGESQSAMFLTTYINAVDPLARVYDGFLVHSRFGPAAPLDGSSLIDELESSAGSPVAVRFRPDLRVPLITVITETDNYTIQVAPIDTGSAPIDDIVAAYEPTNMLMGQHLRHYINFAPQHHYVVQAALSALTNWVGTAQPAPSAPPIEVRETETAQPILDRNGLAQGGIRTPWVDVPTARTSGVIPSEGASESIMAAIFGSGEPFDAATLRRLYPGGLTEYLESFTVALDSAIESGFILPADRAEILALAAATYPYS